MLIMSLFSGVSDAIANFFRDFMWSIISTEITCVQSLINALVNGVLSFGILDNTWIKDGYTACIALMFIILPVKIIYEIIFALVRDDDNNLDINKKIAGAVVCCILAMSLSTVVPLANNLSINVSKAIIGQQYEDNSSVVSSSNSASNSSNTKDFAKELVIGTLCAFGGMERNNTIFSYVTNDKDKGMDIGAERFYDYITDPDEALKGYEGEPSEAKKRTSDGFFSKGIYNRWSFYYRWDTEGEGATDGSDDWDLLGSYENDSSFTEVGKTSKYFGDRSIPSSKEEATKAYNYIEQHSGEYIWDFGYLGTIIGLAIFVILLFIITIEVAMRIIMIGFLYIIGPLACMSLTNYSNPQAFTVWKNSILGMFLVNVTQIFMLQFLMNIASDISKAGNNSTVIASIALYFGAFSAVIAMPKYITSMIGGYEQGIMESLNQMKGTVGAAWGMTGGLLMGASRKVMGRHNDYTGHLTGGIRGAIAGNRNVSGERIGGFRNRASTIRNSIFGSQSNSSRSSATGRTAETNDNSNRNVRYGGLFGNSGVIDRSISNIQSPNRARRFMSGMGNFMGYRGSGPRNWNSRNRGENSE